MMMFIPVNCCIACNSMPRNTARRTLRFALNSDQPPCFSFRLSRISFSSSRAFSDGRFLPATRNAEELADLDALGAEFGPTPLVISSLATAEDTSALIDIVAKFCVSRENFHQKYEAAIMDMIQCAFIRSEKEVVDGYILSDGEIVERLQSLSHMKEIDYWQIVGSVWAASTMSRPILERYGQNVPLLARQILIPVLAVGLCYGIETDVVQMVAQYIIRLLTARGELDSVLRAAFCHHPENYISLMEYYAPEEHGMEPFTRK